MKENTSTPPTTEAIEITGVGSELQGVGRLPDGRAAFVPFALPGERALVCETRRSERYAQCRLEKVLSPSPDRAAPPCPLYGRCGGCAAQHMNYEASLRLKTQVVRQALERIGGLKDAPVSPALGCGESLRYRNKAEYALLTGPDGHAVAGLFEAGSHRAIPVEDCLLQRSESVAALRAANDWFRETRLPAWDKDPKRGGPRFLVTRVNRSGETMVILSVQGNTKLPNVASLRRRLEQALPGRLHSLWEVRLSPRPSHALDGACRPMPGPSPAPFREELRGLTFTLAPQAFFQVNTPQAEILYGEALGAANLTGEETVLDAYCGAGTISLAMARRTKKVIGVELNREAVKSAVENARLNGLSNRAEFIAGDAAREALRLFEGGLRPEVMVVDPPRKGVDERLLNAMLKCAPGRIVYVSCNPATLARDLKVLLSEGTYRLESVQPVDMFPWTEHCECVTMMTKK